MLHEGRKNFFVLDKVYLRRSKKPVLHGGLFSTSCAILSGNLCVREFRRHWNCILSSELRGRSEQEGENFREKRILLLPRLESVI